MRRQINKSLCVIRGGLVLLGTSEPKTEDHSIYNVTQNVMNNNVVTCFCGVKEKPLEEKKLKLLWGKEREMFLPKPRMCGALLMIFSW